MNPVLTKDKYDIIIENKDKLLKNSYINAPLCLVIGKDVSIGANCFIACDGVIGNGTLISSHVGICGREDHDMFEVGSPISRHISSNEMLISCPLSAFVAGVKIGSGSRSLSRRPIGS